MKTYLTILIVLFCGFILACKSSQSDSSKINITNTISQIEFKPESGDSLFTSEITEANQRFKISNAQAFEIVRQVKDLREIIDWKYKNDSSMFNIANISGIPNDTFPNWTINIRQEQPRIKQSTSLMFLIINANNGKIKIWDIPKDTLLTIDEWRKMKNQ